MKTQQQQKDIDFATQQFIGFKAGKNNSSIIDLARNMGLTKEEWLEIRKDGMFNEDDIEEIDNYFENEKP